MNNSKKTCGVLAILAFASIAGTYIYNKYDARVQGEAPIEARFGASSAGASALHADAQSLPVAQAADLHKDSAAIAAKPPVYSSIVPMGQVLRNLDSTISDWRDLRPQSLVVAPLPNLEVNFTMASVREEHGRTIWVGRNPDLPGAFLVSVATKDAWQAVLSYGIPTESAFEIQVAGGVAKVSEQPRGFNCAEPIAGCASTAANRSAPITGDSVVGGDNSKIYYVDVLFFYDYYVQVFRSKDQIKSTLIARLEAANIILENSQVGNCRWRFIDCYEVPVYMRPESLEADLNIMRDCSGEVGNYVLERMINRRADQAVLMLESSRGDGYAGMAELLGQYSVVLWDSGYQTLTHELAHNFGCNHDRLESSSGAKDEDWKYNYAWSVKESGLDCEIYYYGTIMSYATTDRFDYFSNPNISVNGYTIGYHVGHPQAAYNALVMRQNGPWMAILGDEVPEPKILSHPKSVTLTVGASATLSVTVSSLADMRFQWRKGITAISGGTGPTLTISGAKLSDAGVYSVEVTNDTGTSISRPATVTVTTVNVPTTYSDGGGGGGAPSLLYFVAFGMAVTVRQVLRSRKLQKH